MSSRARPLRIKLTLWYLVVYATIQLGLTLAVIWHRRSSVEEWQQGKDAVVAATMVENILVAEPKTWTEELLRSLFPAEAAFAACAVRDPQGALLATWHVSDPAALPFTPEESRPSGAVQAVFQAVEGAEARRLIGRRGTYRLLTLPFRYGDGFFYLQALTPARPSLGPYSELVLVSGPVGLIAALVASWLIAGRAVAPLQRLSDAARSVSPTKLGERLRLSTTDDEVSELQAELNSALERLEEGYRAQERFISNVSHELKTPIAVLLTESQVVQLGAGSLERFRLYAQRVEEEMQRLGTLVEHFLTMARSDLAQGPPLVQRVSVNDLVMDSVQHCSAYAQRGGIHLVPRLLSPEESAVDPVVAGDPELLRTMLDNVVRNAVAHSPVGGAIEIEVLPEGETIVVAVRDHGPGIPEEYLERIFDRLVRVPGAARPGGKGLGLAITKNIAQLHDGSVRVANAAGGGSRFEIRLPHKAEGQGAGGAPASGAGAGSAGKAGAPDASAAGGGAGAGGHPAAATTLAS